jgi:hypothetical protein
VSPRDAMIYSKDDVKRMLSAIRQVERNRIDVIYLDYGGIKLNPVRHPEGVVVLYEDLADVLKKIEDAL